MNSIWCDLYVEIWKNRISEEIQQTHRYREQTTGCQGEVGLSDKEIVAGD